MHRVTDVGIQSLGSGRYHVKPHLRAKRGNLVLYKPTFHTYRIYRRTQSTTATTLQATFSFNRWEYNRSTATTILSDPTCTRTRSFEAVLPPVNSTLHHLRPCIAVSFNAQIVHWPSALGWLDASVANSRVEVFVAHAGHEKRGRESPESLRVPREPRDKCLSCVFCTVQGTVQTVQHRIYRIKYESAVRTIGGPTVINSAAGLFLSEHLPPGTR